MSWAWHLDLRRLSLAWSVIEHIHHEFAARTLFATHYHELTELPIKPGVRNLHVSVKEAASGDFFCESRPGAADRSYVHRSGATGGIAGLGD